MFNFRILSAILSGNKNLFKNAKEKPGTWQRNAREMPGKLTETAKEMPEKSQGNAGEI